MRVFLDFEASSLAKDGYPIEIAWVFEDGRSESWLIRPTAEWTDWDVRAEAIHGIARETLEREGRPAEEVAARMAEVLGGHDLLASAPSWDGKWLSRLLRAGGLPRHALRVRDTEDARRDSVLAELSTVLPSPDAGIAADRILAEVAARQTEAAPAHRALPDAERELAWWAAAVNAAAAHAADMRQAGRGEGLPKL